MKKIIIDIDGTIANNKKVDQDYSDVKPNKNITKKIEEYSKLGYTITLYTSRNMRTYDSNLGLINKHTLPALLDWLEKHSIYFDEILVGKPWPGDGGFYVDDKAVRPSEFVALSEKEILILTGLK